MPGAAELAIAVLAATTTSSGTHQFAIVWTATAAVPLPTADPAAAQVNVHCEFEAAHTFHLPRTAFSVAISYVQAVAPTFIATPGLEATVIPRSALEPS